MTPVIGDIVANTTTNDNKPEIKGTGQTPGDTITVLDNGVPIGTTTVKPDGTWTLTPTTPLADGPHSITATATDPAGNTSAPTPALPFTVDTAPPPPPQNGFQGVDDIGPIQGQIAQNSVVDDNKPEIKGTGQTPGDTITVLDRGQPIGTTTVQPDGTWSFTPTNPLSDGPHIITATATDPAGNTSAPTTPLNFTVDTGAPAIGITLDANVAGDGTVNATEAAAAAVPVTGTVSGTFNAGDTVTIFLNGKTFTGPVDAAGRFSIAVPGIELSNDPDTTIEASVTTQDAAGNTSSASDSVVYRVDTNTPLATIKLDANFAGGDGVVNLAESTQPSIPVTGTVGGDVKVGDTVVVTINGRDFTTTVAAGLVFSVTVPGADLAADPDTTIEARVTTTDAAGNTTTGSTRLQYGVDTTPPAKPTITDVVDDIAPGVGSVPKGGATNDANPEIKGTGEPGAKIEVFDGPKSLGTTTVAPDGTWSLTPAAPLLNGTRTLTAVATDPAGNPSTPSDAYPINVDTTNPVAPTIVRIDDDVAPIVAPIQKNGVTNDTTPTVVGTADANVKVNVYDNGVLIGSTTSDNNGDWTFTPTTPLAQGPQSITATAVNAAGVESPPTGAFPFVIDTTAPTGTTLDNAVDDVAPVTGNVPVNGTTNDATPTFEGKGEPGATIEVFDNGTSLGTTTVKPDGTWELTPSTPLANGPHSVTATATDAAGNTGAPTTALPFTVDATGVLDPVITRATDDVSPQTGLVANGGATNDTRPLLEGTAPAGVTVEIFASLAGGAPQSLGTAVADTNGNWNFTPSNPLAEGDYDFTAQATNAAGTKSNVSAPYGLLIDTTAPTAPVITEVNDDVGAKQGLIANNGPTDDTTPTIVGTGTAGETIRVFDGNALLGTVVVQPGGTWSFTPTTTLTEGQHNFTARAVDAAGNESQPSNTYTVVIDTIAPPKPVITDVVDDIAPGLGSVPKGGATNDANPKIEGTGEAGATIEVFDGPKSLGTTTVAPDGTWSLTPLSPLLNGSRTLTAIASDPAGNPSAESDPYPIDVDSTRPVAPAIVRIDDDVAPVVAPIQKNGVTNDTTPTVVGTADANVKVNIYDNGVLIGSTTSDNNGDWTFTPTTPLSQGPQSITATAVNAAGTESPPTGAFPFVIDTTAPTGTTLDNAVDDVAPVTGNVPVNGTTNDATPTFQGKGEPGATIEVFDNGTSLGTTTVKPDGNWEFTPTSPLANGPHSVTAAATDAAGNTGVPTTALPFTVDTTGVLDPVITRATDDIAPQTGVVANGGATNDTRPLLEGTALAGVLVEIFAKNGQGATISLGTTLADASGNWSFTPPNALAEGNYDFTVQATNAAGTKSGISAPYALVIDTTPPGAPAITTVTDDVGTKQGVIAVNGPTDDTTPTIVGTGTAGETIRVFDGATLLGTTTVQPGGTWSFTPTTTLTEGPHEFTARAVDAAGNESLPSNAYGVVIDTIAPNQPIITDVIDDVGTATGTVPKGGITDDARPEIKGTGEPGATLELFDGPRSLGTTTVAPDGTWSITPTTPLLNGPRSLIAIATDPAGNPSAPSDAYPINVDTSEPVAPTIVRVDDDVAPITATVIKGGVTNDTQPTVVGTAGPSLQVKVFDNGVLIGTTTADVNGNWTLTPAVPLAEGPHSITATATSAAGVESQPTGVYPFTIDTTAPVGTTLDGADDNVGAAQGPIGANTRTDDATPTFKGRGEPGTTITVLDNGTPIGTTTVKPDGTWELTPTTPLADGPHNVTATATDAAGNTGLPTAALPFIVDTSDVREPVITRALDDIDPQTGIVASGGATNDTRPTLAGTARAGDRVEVFYKDAAGTSISLGSTTADANGNWSLTPATPLEQRTYDFTATATSPTGNVSNPSNTYSLVIDTTPPGAPVITTVTDDVGTLKGTVADGGPTDDTTPTIVGTGTVGETIRVFDGNALLGTTTVQPGGTWSFTPTTTLTEGPHAFTARAVDAAGNESAPSNVYDVVIDITAPAKPVITTVLDDVGSVQGPIAKGGITDDARPEIQGTGEPGATIELFDGPLSLGTTTVAPDGSWTLTPTTPLLNGTRTLIAVATDPAGNPSAPSDAYPIDVNTTKPVAPAIVRVDDDVAPIVDTVVKGGVTNDTQPTVVGTAGANLLVTVYDNGVAIGTTRANAAGDWTFTPTAPLSQGLHNIQATATSPAGVESDRTGVYDINIDTTAPVGTTLDSADDNVGGDQGPIGANTRTDDATPTFKGRGEPGATITVLDNGTPIGTTTVKPDGTWELTPTAALADGPHSVTATSTDAAGNVGLPTAALPFIVDTSAVREPVITRALDDIDPQTGIVASGGATNDTRPTLAGTARAGDRVEVFYKDAAGTLVSIGTVVADGSGNWSLTPPTPLEQRLYEFTATATSPTGNVSNPSNTYSLVIDTTPPGAPVITTVTDDVGALKGTVADGGPTDDTTPTIVGTGNPGETIRVFDGTTLLGTTTVLPTGSWSFTPPTTLVEGPHAFTARAVDAAGNESVPSNVYDVVVDTTAPTKPVITTVLDDVGSSQGPIAKGGVTDDARPEIRGTAEPGTTIEVFDGPVSLGTTTVAPDGTWTFTPTTPLVNGTRTLTAVATDPAGNPSEASDPYPINVDPSAPPAPAIIRVDDDVAPIVSPIQKNGVTNDTRPEVVGTAGPNLLVTVYDNGQPIGTTTADAAGNWTFTPTTPLSEGGHAITATATSAAGVESAPTGDFPFRIDLTAPTGTTLDAAVDDVSPVTGNVPANGTTNDATPTFQGKGEPGATITVLDNGVPIGTTTVDANGNWTLTPTTALVDGPHSVTATATDAAGNTGAPTAALPFIVDTKEVTDPTITRASDNVDPVTGVVASGGATNDTTPLLEGRAPANVDVEVFASLAGGAPVSLGTVKADANGNWSLTPTTPLAEGSYAFTAQATNAAGTKSNVSAPYGLLIDTTPPNAPAITSVTDDVGSPRGPLASGQTTDDNTPTIAGTGNAGETIRVFDGSTLLGSALVQPDGTWSFTPTSTLVDGPHDFVARAVDAAGNVSDRRTCSR